MEEDLICSLAKETRRFDLATVYKYVETMEWFKMIVFNFYQIEAP